jgi:allantoinase
LVVAMTDLVVRGGTLVTPDGQVRADLAVEHGIITSIAPELSGAREEIDARDLYVLPGLIDVHVHFNEPGRADWEGAATGSRALAAGGGTMFFDMPLNSTPCTLDAEAFDSKRAALEASSITDFGLWGGLVPGSVPDMAELANRGVVGFKAFMCDSGLPEFPRSDEATLLAGLVEATRLGLPVAVHAESDELTKRIARARPGRAVSDFLSSRPVQVEVEAIESVLLLAAEARARLHIVHVSSGRGVAAAVEARARGVDVSIETCPHYLFFTEEDLDRLGAVAKCAPPLRSSGERDALWSAVVSGDIDIVASDHSPTDPALRQGDFLNAWGGIAGVQSTLAVLLEQGHHERGLPLERIASLSASEPARRFHILGRGGLVAGKTADMVLVDLDAAFTLDANDLHQRHRVSPYVGASFRGTVRRTIRRGETIFMDGQIVARTHGHFVRPAN